MFYRSYVPVFLLFLFVVGVYSTDAYAVTDRCPRHQVKTDLKAKLAKTRKFRASISDINGYLNNHDRSQGTVLAFVQLGGEALSVETEYKFGVQDIGGGKYCVMLEKVRARFYAAPSIVMPSNFRKGSCEYKLILKHEKRHLNAIYGFHKKNTGKYQAYLGRIARAVPIYPPVTTEEDALKVKQEIGDYFADQFYEQVHKSLNELGRAQSKIDSPQEYRGVGRKIDNCSKVHK